jgi:predicted enzyme related to lactoylglutathione lyase
MSQGPSTGEIIWFDIPVKDFDTSKAFYGELLGWKFKPMGDDKNSNYWMIEVGKDTIGGLRECEEPLKKTDCPIIYFGVPKLDTFVSRAKKLGGTLVGDRVDIPGDMGSFHWLRDPDGNLIALWAQS